jgi:hypothetical protein
VSKAPIVKYCELKAKKSLVIEVNEIRLLPKAIIHLLVTTSRLVLELFHPPHKSYEVEVLEVKMARGKSDSLEAGLQQA